jgi:hypothetical protein
MSQESAPSFMTLNQSNNGMSCCSATKRMFQHMYQGLTADPIVQRRVGRAVAEASTQPHSRLILPRSVDALANTTRGKKFTQR